MKEKWILMVVCFFSFSALGQNLNDYKYIIIPETYDFTGKIDQYRLNSLTKFLFEKEGFSTVMKMAEKPADLKENPCLGLLATVKDNSGTFVTKLVLRLENCSGEVVFESKEGRSREKQYEVAYHEALRDAFESVKALQYNYSPVAESEMPKDQKQSKSSTTTSQVTAQPADNKPEKPANEPEGEVVVSAIPSAANYTLKGVEYNLHPNEKGFGLYQQNGAEPVALLIAAGKPGTYIYHSLSRQGIAYFKNDKIIVEFYDTSTGQKVKMEYKKN